MVFAIHQYESAIDGMIQKCLPCYLKGESLDSYGGKNHFLLFKCTF